MNALLKIVSFLALLLVTVPSILHFTGSLDHDSVLLAGIIGTAMWFASTPFWMGRELPVDSDHVEI